VAAECQSLGDARYSTRRVERKQLSVELRRGGGAQVKNIMVKTTQDSESSRKSCRCRDRSMFAVLILIYSEDGYVKIGVRTELLQFTQDFSAGRAKIGRIRPNSHVRNSVTFFQSQQYEVLLYTKRPQVPGFPNFQFRSLSIPSLPNVSFHRGRLRLFWCNRQQAGSHQPRKERK